MSDTYFMDPVDRMTIDLLSHYAFTLHEDISKTTDEDIQLAREFATEYLKNDYKWKDYDSRFSIFVNTQVVNAMINNNVDQIKTDVYQKILSLNNLMNVYDWYFDIYYDVDMPNCLLLAKRSSFGSDNIDLSYNFNDKTFQNCDTKVTDEMYKLGNIYYDCMNVDELESIKI